MLKHTAEVRLYFTPAPALKTDSHNIIHCKRFAAHLGNKGFDLLPTVQHHLQDGGKRLDCCPMQRIAAMFIHLSESCWEITELLQGQHVTCTDISKRKFFFSVGFNYQSTGLFFFFQSNIKYLFFFSAAFPSSHVVSFHLPFSLRPHIWRK